VLIRCLWLAREIAFNGLLLLTILMWLLIFKLLLHLLLLIEINPCLLLFNLLSFFRELHLDLESHMVLSL
jgi:hypothetical protein